jgi:hypothetical protein
MAHEIDGLRWKPLWVSHLGCIKGCLEFLNMNISTAWLYGSTGHAFIINIHEELCPSGPTAWKTEMLFKLSKNIGYSIKGIESQQSQENFKDKQKQAWKLAQGALDKMIPCYGWELEIPEFYVVYGYDDVGYYYSGPQCDDGKGPKPWNELGVSKIGCLEMYTIMKGDPESDATVVKRAFECVWEHARNPEKWILPKYKSGLQGYDLWLNTLKEGKADGFGLAYNTAVWYECRNYGVYFLEEAKERIGGNVKPLFDEAKEQYEIVTHNLNNISKLFPFNEYNPEHIKDPERRESSIGYLTKAREAERTGLELLEKIMRKL